MVVHYSFSISMHALVWNDKLQSADSRMGALERELLRSKTLYEMDKTALETDRVELRSKYMELVEKSKADHSKMKRLKLQTKTACAQLKVLHHIWSQTK